jgi:hypothetical protein
MELTDTNVKIIFSKWDKEQEVMKSCKINHKYVTSLTYIYTLTRNFIKRTIGENNAVEIKYRVHIFGTTAEFSETKFIVKTAWLNILS